MCSHGSLRRPTEDCTVPSGLGGIRTVGEGEARADASPGSLRHFAEDLQTGLQGMPALLQGRRYLIPTALRGKKVMLKIKGKIIRIFHDQDLIASYEEPEAKHAIVGDPAIYRLLSQDKEQIKGNTAEEGRATRGLVTRTLYPRGGDQIAGRIRASNRCVMEQLTYERLKENLIKLPTHPHALRSSMSSSRKPSTTRSRISRSSTASLRKK